MLCIQQCDDSFERNKLVHKFKFKDHKIYLLYKRKQISA
jgi:hypothetical protein